MSCASPIDFGSVVKHPGERIALEFDWFDNVAFFWEGGEFYRTGDVRRPLRPTGYAYRVVADGTSGFKEPRWLRVSNTTDGSVEWQPIPANLEGIDIITSADVDVPSGLTVDGAPTWEGAEVYVIVEGGTDGEDYAALCEVVTQSGQTLVGVLTVKVRASKCD